MLSASGCQLIERFQPIEEPVAEPVVLPETVEPSAPDKQMYPLLDAGDAALADDHLTFPFEGSAWDYFERVQKLDPDNAEAARGIERIAERYIALAIEAADRQSFASARSLLRRAILVLPDHPNIEPTELQLRLLESAEREKIVLDRKLVSSRDEDISQTLDGIGTAARRPECRITIDARSDEEGRWLYKMLNLSPGEQRIRASMQIASPPSVHLLCFDPSSAE
jgi:hypothetical protein